MNKLLLLLIIFFGYAIKSNAQEFNRAKMDSFMTLLENSNQAMGNLAILKKGELIYQRAIGLAFVNENTPADIHTRYRIGSVTKMFTAVIILQLIEEKKLKSGTLLSRFFPEVSQAENISIEHLLQHRSGIHNFTDDSLYLTYYQQPKTEKEMLTIIAASAPDFIPGEKTSYSNSNYVLLGYIAEKITGKSYSQLLNDRITNKLNLKDTYVGNRINIKEKECYSYQYAKSWIPEPETAMSIPGAAGNLVSTASNLNVFISALFNGKLLSEQSLAKMKAMRDGYGLGMIELPFYNRNAYGHSGGIDGFGAMLGFFPSDTVAVSWCTNGQVYLINDILIGVLSIYFNKPYTLPSFTTALLDIAELEQYTGTYASEDIQLKITVFIEDEQLMAQATGQSSFPLENSGKDIFRFNPAKIVMQFQPAKKEFILKQGGKDYLFTKE